MKYLIYLTMILILAASVLAAPPVRPGLEKCWDGIDNDQDGDIDMADSDCDLFVDGNPSCSDINAGWTEVKIEEPDNYVGTWTFNGVWSLGDGNTFTVTTGDEKYFDWLSNIGIDAVISKGSSAANIYVYDPEATFDNGLHSPVNNGGNIAGISHISVCFDKENNEVPEFTTIGAAIALAGAGLVIMRRKKK